MTSFTWSLFLGPAKVLIIWKNTYARIVFTFSKDGFLKMALEENERFDTDMQSLYHLMALSP